MNESEHFSVLNIEDSLSFMYLIEIKPVVSFSKLVTNCVMLCSIYTFDNIDWLCLEKKIYKQNAEITPL